MKQNMWDGGTEQSACIPPSCDRAENLVTYLYGEASASEAKSFEHHLERCPACREEFAALSRVRISIGEWRAETFDVAAHAPLTFTAPAAATPARAFAALSDWRAQKHSVVAGLRQFFHFSPLWLRAGGVVAVLLTCVLAGIVIINSGRGRITASRVIPPAQTKRSPQNKATASSQVDSEPNLSVRLNPNNESSSRDVPTSSSPGHKEATSIGRTQRSRGGRRNLTSVPAAPAHDQLPTAEDEREVVAREESGLPQLYDLLGERQMPAMDEDNSPRLRDLLREVK